MRPTRRRATVQHTPAQQMLGAAEAMLRHALASGIVVPEAVVETVELACTHRRAGGEGELEPPTPALLRRLARAHAELVRLVAPATPRTILLLSHGRRSRLAMLGPVRLVRQMLVAVLVLLAAFVALSTTDYVNGTGGDILNSTGLSLLVNELFFLAAGGLGAAFSALFTAYRYIAEGTYDPKFESSYWLRFILGLMAGLLLPALVPLGADAEAEGISRPLLALLGGFSASVLYRILERLVGAVESLVRADSRELRAARRAADLAQASDRARLERLELVGHLRRLEQQARAGGTPDQLAEDLGRMVGTLLPVAPQDADDASDEHPQPLISPPAR
ncbi:hypothetical protein C8N24_6594 [Solirubrobacter pauli]|uniref:Uncharacterized protein n=1 Tax=Solirubrobacter pauli TaxID=166793 RepID=A0A660KVD8_9ACTN|nr:hypothetical protein [Solirubrobacter pauli]RKQ84963.1 hypothetical protein C8N24_6594 [Solirubrobacter pauli]